MKVLITDKLAPEGIEILKKEGFEVIVKSPDSVQELYELIKDVEGIIIRSQTKLTSDVIEKAQNLKVIGRAGVGLDNVDIESASRKGIIVMNAPGGNTISTCEHTWALILSLKRNIPQAHESIVNGEWKRSKFMGKEVYGKILGIIGLGRIGREVAKRAISFGMKVIAYDPFISEEIARKSDVKLVSLEELLKESDIITIHTPLTEETRHLISYKEFSMMKKGTKIVNCARGGIIDEEALYKALEEGKISGAALDVYEKEPPEDNPLFKFKDRCIFTPHLGASTQEAQVNVAIEISKCVADALKNKGIKNAVNFPCVDLELLKVLKPYIELGEKMGLLASQLVNWRVKRIKIGFWGEVSGFDSQPILLSILKGFLEPIIEENVNYVNAYQLVKERAITVKTSKSAEDEEFANALTLVLEEDKEQLLIVGTVFTQKRPRIVKINNFYVEIIPQGWLLFISNKDKPGIIGGIGTVLGKNNINIAGMTFGRKEPGGEALTILNVDGFVPREVMEEIKTLPHIIDVKLIKL